MCDESCSEAKKEKEICRYFIHGRCKKGKWCEFSHHRPLCRYGNDCWFGPRCWNSHGITPRVNSIRAAKKPGKQNARNKRRREKRKALMAEAKASLVRIKELETQLELKEEKKDEHQECGRQLTELQAQLERETQRADQNERRHREDITMFEERVKYWCNKSKEHEEKISKFEERCRGMHEEVHRHWRIDREERAKVLKLEQEKNAKLVQALELEKQKKLMQALEQLQTQAQEDRANLRRVQSQLPGGQEMQTPPRVVTSPGYSGPARLPTFFGPAERGYGGHAGPAPPGCGHPPDPEQS